MDIRIPLELRAKIPQLGEASEEADPMVWLKLQCVEAGWTWYIIEMQPLDQDAIFYGYRVGWDEELTYFKQSDLELRTAEWGFPIVQDEAFVPCRLSEVQAYERGDRKFPLGQLVAALAQQRRLRETIRNQPNSCAGIGGVTGASWSRKMSQRTSSRWFMASGC
jgi:hypothetical protein